MHLNQLHNMTITETLGQSGHVYDQDDANQVLPLVKSIVHEMTRDFDLLRSAGRERRKLEAMGVETRAHQANIEELKDKVGDLSSKIEGYIRELTDLGIDTRDLELGLVDFPSVQDGGPAYLSWRQGEDSVDWWRPSDKGYSARKSVQAPEVRHEA